MSKRQITILAPKTAVMRDIISQLEKAGYHCDLLEELPEPLTVPGDLPPALFLIDSSLLIHEDTVFETELPVILLTGGESRNIRTKGILQAISKPVTIEKLLPLISHILRKRKILITDDTPSFREMVAAEFNLDSYELIFAENGLTGYQAARQHHPDLITMDIEMPVMDGYKACEMIRHDPSTEDIPIIFVTTLGNEEDIDRGFRAGAIEYFVKPFQPGRLGKFVHNLFVKMESRRTVPIAILDHRKTSRKITEFAFQKHGFQTSPFSSLNKLIEQFKQGYEPELLLFNMDDPDTSFETSLKELKLLRPHLPVLTLTDENRKARIIHALKAGAVDYVLAPFVEEELIARSETHIRLHKYIRQLSNANQRLRELSVTDPLTGLFNRGYLNRMLKAEIKKLSRREEWLSCIMIDIDHFKQINDTYGHITGDFVLTELANIMRELSRDSDIVTRYGGEEFVLLLPQTDPDGAFILAEKIRTNVEKKKFKTGDVAITVTISCGIHGIRNFLEGRNLIQYADEALYQAKETGRNRTVCHETS
ncbi:MAG: diguanylate cyclase [Acidobacteria bacterium]|nr:diguanylate cyclase [Acidobacteriota bacterium]